MYIYMCLPCIHQKNDEDMASWGMAQRKMVQETQKHTVPSVILVGVQQHLSAIIIPYYSTWYNCHPPKQQLDPENSQC